jgi:hypothetical protein
MNVTTQPSWLDSLIDLLAEVDTLPALARLVFGRHGG